MGQLVSDGIHPECEIEHSCVIESVLALVGIDIAVAAHYLQRVAADILALAVLFTEYNYLNTYGIAEAFGVDHA